MSDRVAGHPVPFVRRVRVRNYRSIGDCDVTLGPLTVLLGFNASGKTNFLDALRFVSEAVAHSPTQAAAGRGDLDTLLHRGPAGVADSFDLRLDLRLRLPEVEGEVAAWYGFEIGRDPAGEAPLLVRREVGELALPDGPLRLPLEIPGLTSRLRLPASAVDTGAPQAVLESALTSMRFYDFDTAALAALDEPRSQTAYPLGPDGAHLGHVLRDINQQDPSGKERLDAYLAALVPGALGVDERPEGRYSTVQARFRAGERDGVEVFLREEMSEGTLRAAGVLAALFQTRVQTGRVPLVAIEEPETALHPAGVGALYEALDDAARRTQVIVTSQSSDLLDNEYADLTHIRAVANVDGVTVIGEVDHAGRAIVGKKLMSLSELHRSGQMWPELPSRPPAPDGGTGCPGW
jgi:predicted ATPase